MTIRSVVEDIIYRVRFMREMQMKRETWEGKCSYLYLFLTGIFNITKGN